MTVDRTIRDERRAANARLYRRRHGDGQRVLSVTAYLDRAERAMRREGRLLGCKGEGEYSQSEIEAALTLFIDARGRE